jgi:omega-amidase
MGSWYQEMWNCPYSNSSFPTYAEDIDGGITNSPSLAMLSEVAREKKVTIVGGSIPERSGGKLYNTCCVVDKNGELKAKFRKVRITYNFALSTKSSFRLR